MASNDERRQHRSEHPQEAIEDYLASICKGLGLQAVVLASDDGTLISGAGQGDLELLAQVGGQHQEPVVELDDGLTLYTRPLTVNHLALRVVSVGKPLEDESALASIERILARPTPFDS